MPLVITTNCDSCTEVRECGVYYAYDNVFYWCVNCDEVDRLDNADEGMIDSTPVGSR